MMTIFKVKGIYNTNRDDFTVYLQSFKKVAWVYGGKDIVERPRVWQYECSLLPSVVRGCLRSWVLIS